MPQQKRCPVRQERNVTAGCDAGTTKSIHATIRDQNRRKVALVVNFRES